MNRDRHPYHAPAFSEDVMTAMNSQELPAILFKEFG